MEYVYAEFFGVFFCRFSFFFFFIPKQLLLQQADILAVFPAEHDNACKVWPEKAYWNALHRRDKQPEWA